MKKYFKNIILKINILLGFIKLKIRKYIRIFRVYQYNGFKTEKLKKDIEQTICLNCKTVHSANYCPRCGQNRNEGVLSSSHIFSNLVGGIYNISGGFGRTILELFTRPGYMILDFLKG